MMMNMGGSGGGSMGGSMAGPMGGGSSGSMGMMPDPSMVPMSPYMAGPGMPGNMQMGYTNAGFDITWLFGLLLNLALNILSLALVLALIIGTIVFIKRYLLEDNVNLSTLFRSKVNGTCVSCGQSLQAGWNCCPKCGKDRLKSSTPTSE